LKFHQPLLFIPGPKAGAIPEPVIRALAQVPSRKLIFDISMATSIEITVRGS
jgi:hypothetical protein